MYPLEHCLEFQCGFEPLGNADVKQRGMLEHPSPGERGIGAMWHAMGTGWAGMISQSCPSLPTTSPQRGKCCAQGSPSTVCVVLL